MSDDCLFCKMVEGEIDCEKVYEDRNFLAFLDINPVNKGHTLLIPKKHCKDLLSFPEDLDHDFIETAKKVANAVLEGTDAEGFNLSMNNGSASGQEIFHAHFHIIPRWEDDGHEHWSKTEYEAGELEEYGQKISEHL